MEVHIQLGHKNNYVIPNVICIYTVYIPTYKLPYYIHTSHVKVLYMYTTYITLFSPSLSSLHRHPNFSSTMGVHSSSAEEAQIPLHGQLGEQKGGSVSVPRCPGLCHSVGKAQKQTKHDLRQGGTSTSLLLQT